MSAMTRTTLIFAGGVLLLATMIAGEEGKSSLVGTTAERIAQRVAADAGAGANASDQQATADLNSRETSEQVGQDWFEAPEPLNPSSKQIGDRETSVQDQLLPQMHPDQPTIERQRDIEPLFRPERSKPQSSPDTDAQLAQDIRDHLK